MVSHALQEIQSLDPRKDHQRIVFLSYYYDFPLDASLLSILILLRSFSVPRISALLDATGRWQVRGPERAATLVHAMAQLIGNGYDSPGGQAVLARMNKVHNHYETVNDDFVYLLAQFVLEPIAWNKRFGKRLLCEQERLALLYFWREVGRRMAIQHIPSTIAELQQFSQNFEREHCRPADSNHRLYLALQDVLAGLLPAVLRPLLRWGLPCVLDDRFRENLMLPAPPRLLKSTTITLLRLRAWAASCLPTRQHPYAPLVRLGDSLERSHTVVLHPSAEQLVQGDVL